MTPEEFKRAFPFDEGEPCSERALVQLGLPAPDEIVLWFAPARSGSVDDLLDVDVSPSGSVAPRVALDLGKEERRFGVVRQSITGLGPGTEHRIRLRIRGESEPREVRARTAPRVDDAAPFSFLAHSCFAPFGEAKAATRALNLDTLRRFEERARGVQAPPPAFSLGLGDQVYVDAGSYRSKKPISMLGGWNNDRILYDGSPEPYFDLLYRAHFSFAPLAAAFAHMPSALMWDDHEICDGWGSLGDEAKRVDGERWRRHYETARSWFIGYQAARNPLREEDRQDALRALLRLARPSTAFPGKGPELHFQFEWGSACSFFVMDLRSQRSLDHVIADEQFSALEAWLERREPPGRLYVLSSPIPLTLPKWVKLDPARWLPFRADDVRDQWWSESGFRQATRIKKLLAARFADGRDRLLVLSGDVHYSEVRKLTTDRGQCIGHEVISSGLSQDSFIPDLGHFGFIEDSIDRFRVSPLKSTSLGRHHGPGFAELFVSPRPDGPPSVEIQAHFGRTDRETSPRRSLDSG